MSIASASPVALKLGPGAAGMLLAPQEFDVAEFEDGYRYELIHGVLVVSPAPLPQERDPNEELGHWLRNYQQTHPEGVVLDITLHEHDILVGDDRRRADRAIWIGLGRLPRPDDPPAIVVEFVSAGRRSLMRDYDEKRRQYESIGVREYWVFNRFQQTLTVFRTGERQVLTRPDTYRTPLLPGFELPLERLFYFANRWDKT